MIEGNMPEKQIYLMLLAASYRLRALLRNESFIKICKAISELQEVENGSKTNNI